VKNTIQNEEVLFQSEYPQNRGSYAFRIILHIFLMILFVSVAITQAGNIYLKIGFSALAIYVFGQQIYFGVRALKVKEFFILKDKLRVNFSNSSIDVPLEEVYYKVELNRNTVFEDVSTRLYFFTIRSKERKFVLQIHLNEFEEQDKAKLINTLSSISGRERCDFVEPNYAKILQEKFQLFPLLKKSIKE